MRRFAIALALASMPLTPGMGQQPAERKNFSITTPKAWSFRIGADNMARDGFILHLKGKVEIQTFLQRSGDSQSFVLRADEADFNIDTGAVESRGNVSMSPRER